MKRLLLTIYSLTVFFCAGAQEEFIEPSKMITRFSFDHFTGGVILLHARFDHFADTLNFILDSGSGGISLDSTTAAEYGLKPEPSDRIIRGIAGVKNVSFVHNKTLHLPGLDVPELDFHVNDYSILTAVYGERIDGIIGYAVMSRYIIKINYDSLKIEFWTKGNIRYPRGGYLLKPTINSIPIQNMRIRDESTVNARFLYDMGAGLNMMLSTDFIRDSNVLSHKRKLYAKEAEGLGGKVDMAMTVIKEVKLGPYRFRNVPIYVFSDTFNVTSYPYLGGLIGNDILRRFNVIINYDKKDIHLLPNSHYNDPFDYAYSGLELYMLNGLIVIGDVAKRSPADLAGIKEGDVVIGINNTLGGSLQQYKAIVQSTGEKFKLFIRRDGELMMFEIKVKNIMH